MPQKRALLLVGLPLPLLLVSFQKTKPTKSSAHNLTCNVSNLKKNILIKTVPSHLFGTKTFKVCLFTIRCALDHFKKKLTKKQYNTYNKKC